METRPGTDAAIDTASNHIIDQGNVQEGVSESFAAVSVL
jgi:hypothetical protein